MPLGGYALDGYFSMSKLGSRCVVTPLTTVTIPTEWLFLRPLGGGAGYLLPGVAVMSRPKG